jgi:hypothetical protein
MSPTVPALIRNTGKIGSVCVGLNPAAFASFVAAET